MKQVHLYAFYSKCDLEAVDNAIMVNSGIIICFVVSRCDSIMSVCLRFCPQYTLSSFHTYLMKWNLILAQCG